MLDKVTDKPDGWSVLESFVEKAGEGKIKILKSIEEYE